MSKKATWKRWMSAVLTLAMVFTLMLTPVLASTEPDEDAADPAEAAEELGDDTDIPADTDPEEVGEEPEEGPETQSLASEESEEDYGLQVLASDTVTILETGVGYSSVQNAVDAAGNGQTIVMNANSTEGVTIPSDLEITLDLNGYTLKGPDYGNAITNYGTLTLTDSAGGGTIIGSNQVGRGVNNIGTFTMKSGVITGGNSTGGGVSNSGSFTMEGGEISGNNATYYGAGVANYGTFTMTGGKICDNTGSVYGHSGGVYNEGTFTMTGGEISGNEDQRGGGVYNTGSFTMEGGKITGNTAYYYGGGVYNAGEFTMSGGEINENRLSDPTNICRGGGVYNTGTFYMTDGEICGNTIETYDSGEGGGVFNFDGTFTMEGGEISGNYAYYGGGGVDNFRSSFTMTGGKITGNTTAGYGGGVLNEAGNMTMEDGEIIGNTSGGYGGGVYAENCTFRMKGGVISGNTAHYGGGVADAYLCSFTMEGGEIIDNWATREGGGVYNTEEFIMKDGVISGNAAVADEEDDDFNGYGGGVYNILGASFTMSGGIVYNNIAQVESADILCDGFSTCSLVPAEEMGSGDVTILGWYIDKYGSRYANTENPQKVTDVANITNVKLIAAYEVTVTYELEDGTVLDTVTVNPTKGENNTAAYKEDLDFPEDACLLASWNTEPDGSGETYMPGDAITKNVTLYAQLMEHDYYSLISKEETCTEGGSIGYTCNYCGRIEYVPTDPLGHDWENAETIVNWTGSDEDGYTGCEVILICERFVFGHGYCSTPLFIECDVTTETTATCTDDGEIIYTASGSALDDMGEEVTVKETKTVAASALGHGYVAEVTDPTCTDQGYTTYTCSRCDDCYATDYTDALGHIYSAEKVNFVWSIDDNGQEKLDDVTCTAVFECLDCGHLEEVDCDVEHFEDGDTDADCTTPYYTDMRATAEVDSRDDETVIAYEDKYLEGSELGHIWKLEAEDTDISWVGNDEDGYTACQVTLKCQRDGCDETLTITCDVASETTDASCEKNGNILYTASGSETDDDGKEVTVEVSRTVIIPATGHTPVTDAAVEPTCTETGLTEGSHCEVCDAVLVEQEVISATGHAWDDGVVTTEPTCTEDGVLTYTCLNDESHSYTEPIPATGHAWDDGVVTTEPTCTEDGVLTYTCLNDESHTYTEVLEATGHTVVTDEAVAATCTETGLTEGSHCEVCGEVFVAQEETPALGHSWIEREISLETEDTDRSETDIHLVCYRCGDTQDQLIVVETVSTGVEAHSTFGWRNLVTADEVVDLFENGSEIDLELLIAALADEDVPGEDADLVADLLGDQDFTAVYLDIRAEIHVAHADGTEETISREDTLSPVTITVVIPDQLLEADGDDYMVIRVHDGEAGALDTAEADGALTFTTDKFSTYALVKLAPEEEADETENPTETGDPDETDETEEPEVTPEPDETPEPTETEEPVETEKPEVTPEPAETGEPEATPEPAETEEPVSSDEPAEEGTNNDASGEQTGSGTTGSGSSGSSSSEATSPQTGDAGNLVLWIVLFALCGAALIGTSIAVKKRDNG